MVRGVNTLKIFTLTWHVKFLKAALWYNAVVFLAFMAVYAGMDFDKHFTADKPVSLRGKWYFALMTHTTAGCNDIVPKTDFARTVIAVHVLIAWLQIFLVFLSR